MMNLEILRQELLLPAYTGLTDKEAADLLNDPVVSRDRTSMTGSEIFANTDTTEYNALTDAKKQQWLSFCAIGVVDPFGPAVQVAINIMGNGATITNLQAARVETISRATELGLPVVNEGDIIHART